MAVRREAIQQVGLLDEQYHMYVEEIDWSKRIVTRGWQAYCAPAAVVTHFGGQSTDQIKISSFINLWTSRFRFYRKHYSPLKVWLAGQIVQLGMRRKVTSDKKAVTRDVLTEAEYSERLASYKQVIRTWQAK
jgi:GT2 family glycosyltransferase